MAEMHSRTQRMLSEFCLDIDPAAPVSVAGSVIAR